MLFWMKNSIEVKSCITRENVILEITILLYKCYDEHEALRICNTTVYLSDTLLYLYNPYFRTTLFTILYTSITPRKNWYQIIKTAIETTSTD